MIIKSSSSSPSRLQPVNKRRSMLLSANQRLHSSAQCVCWAKANELSSQHVRVRTHSLQLHLFIFNSIVSLLGPDVSGPSAWRETIHTMFFTTLMTRRWWAITSSAATAFAAGHESASSIIKNHSLIFIHNCHQRFQRHKDKQISAPLQSDRGPLSQQRRALRRTECFSLF